MGNFDLAHSIHVLVLATGMVNGLIDQIQRNSGEFKIYQKPWQNIRPSSRWL